MKYINMMEFGTRLAYTVLAVWQNYFVQQLNKIRCNLQDKQIPIKYASTIGVH